MFLSRASTLAHPWTVRESSASPSLRGRPTFAQGYGDRAVVPELVDTVSESSSARGAWTIEPQTRFSRPSHSSAASLAIAGPSSGGRECGAPHAPTDPVVRGRKIFLRVLGCTPGVVRMTSSAASSRVGFGSLTSRRGRSLDLDDPRPSRRVRGSRLAARQMQRAVHCSAPSLTLTSTWQHTVGRRDFATQCFIHVRCTHRLLVDNKLRSSAVSVDIVGGRAARSCTTREGLRGERARGQGTHIHGYEPGRRSCLRRDAHAPAPAADSNA